MDPKTTKSAGDFADAHKQGLTFINLSSISGGMFEDKIKIHLDNGPRIPLIFLTKL